MKIGIFPPLALLSLVCIACQSNPLAQQPPGSSPTTQTQSSASAVQISKGSLPPPQTFDLQVNEDQVVARLTQISFTEDSILVNMAVTNVSREVIQLNARDDMRLFEDTYSNKYRLAVPPDNPSIQIQPGTTLKGQFVFIGRVSPKATSLSLSINPDYNYGDRKNFPRISFSNMPIQR